MTGAAGNLLLVFALLSGAAAAPSQERPAAEAGVPGEVQEGGEGGEFPWAGLVTVLAPVLFPKFIGDACRLKEFIRSEEFAALRDSAGDPGAVDAVFFRARELSWGNVYEALLISAVATIDHRRVGVDIPVVYLWLPLTSEFEEDFQLRMRSLPSRLYADTPDLPAGDRDKLQHFFGSAFLAALSESPDAAERVGDFVEWGEERFIVGGAADERDERANRQGREFGLRLLERGAGRPSEFLRPAAGESAVPGEAPCARGAVVRSAGNETEER
jgi:hypothetical protein